jgi:hypothetical protein
MSTGLLDRSRGSLSEQDLGTLRRRRRGVTGLATFDMLDGQGRGSL